MFFVCTLQVPSQIVRSFIAKDPQRGVERDGCREVKRQLLGKGERERERGREENAKGHLTAGTAAANNHVSAWLHFNLVSNKERGKKIPGKGQSLTFAANWGFINLHLFPMPRQVTTSARCPFCKVNYKFHFPLPDRKCPVRGPG